MAASLVYSLLYQCENANANLAELAAAAKQCTEGRQFRKVNFLYENETHYLLVIHGTFDAPNENNSPLKWYQLDPSDPSNFCNLVQAYLAGLEGQKDAVWREIPQPVPPHLEGCHPFSWDGTNTHKGRLEAAAKLCRIFLHISRNDPSARIHVVAHSHGGNVLLKAIELYMTKLTDTLQSEWHPMIRESFWTSYSNQYKLVGRWRRFDRIRWWRKWNPFLILRRTLAGETTRGLERYTYAYYKWFDDLLGLPYIRQQTYLNHRKASSPVSNALGRMVFLGTPFVMRRWSAVGIASVVLHVIFQTAFVFCFLFVYSSFLLAVFTVSTDETTIEKWRNRLYLGLVLFVFLFIPMVISLTTNYIFESGNVYHRMKYKWSAAMSGLVAHAGVLDEASMALSAEPIVEAFLEPQMKQLLDGNIFRSWPQNPRQWTVLRTLFYFYRVFYSLYINFFGLLPLLQIGFNRLIAPLFGSNLVKLIQSLALGMEAIELSYAHVYIDRTLNLPSATDIQTWNVQKILVAHKEGVVPSLRDREGNGSLSSHQEGSLLQAQSSNSGSERIGTASGMNKDVLEGQLVTRPEAGPGPEVGAEPEAGSEKSSQLVGRLGQEGGRQESGDGRGVDFRNGRVGGGTEGEREEDLLLQLLKERREREVGEEAAKMGVVEMERRREEERERGAELVPVWGRNYSFLWDNVELEKRAEMSFILSRLQPRMNRIRCNPELTRAQFEIEMKRLCIMFEERFLELTGSYEFSHSVYYKNRTIIYGIAHFLMKGYLPSWADEEEGVKEEIHITVDPTCNQ